MESSDALVIYGSTGRRVQITPEDLQMPEHIKQYSNAPFFAKQWPAVSSFWYNRILKETSLQKKTKKDILMLIEEDIKKRWSRKKSSSAIHKRQKRLLSSSGGAGTPSDTVCVSNFCAISEYKTMTEEEKENLRQIIHRKVHTLVPDALEGKIVVVDELTHPPLKKVKTDEVELSQGSLGPSALYLCQLKTKELAAKVIAHLHGSEVNNFTVVCRFWNES